MATQAAATLVGGVEHDPRQAMVACPLDHRKIGCPVGEQHGHDAPPPRRLGGKRLEAGNRVAVGKQADLDDVYAEPAHALDGGCDARRHHRQVADRGTDTAPAGDLRHGVLNDCRGQGAQRPGRRVLEIDDVDAAIDGGLRLRCRDHAGEHTRHGAMTPSICVRCSSIRCISRSHARRSRGPAVLSMAIFR